MIQLRRVAVGFAGFVFVGVCFASGEAAGQVSMSPAKSHGGSTQLTAAAEDREVKEIADLLDQWTGQSEILEQAASRLRPILNQNPKNYRALKEVARYQIMLGYRHQTWAQYDGYAYELGAYEPGALEGAEMTIRKALEINPKFAEGFALLGYIQQQQTNLDEAVATFAKAEALGTNDPWLQIYWARTEENRGYPRVAEAHWKKAADTHTSSPKALAAIRSHLIAEAIKRGDHETAVALYRETIRSRPTNAWTRAEFATYLSESLGRNDEALAEARATLAIMDYTIGHHMLAMILYAKWADLVSEGKVNAAEPYFREAEGIHPDLDDVMVTRGATEKGEKLAKALIALKGVSIDARYKDGTTALLLATNKNRVATVRYLLDLKANPNIGDRNGWTPLLSAADEGNREIVDMLLQRGADIHARLDGKSAATLAAEKEHFKLAEYLAKREAEASPALVR
jgi:Flp pilus assembly protein TadD